MSTLADLFNEVQREIDWLKRNAVTSVTPYVKTAGDAMGGPLSLPDGTTASAALQFNGDPDTGIRRTGANGMSLLTGAVDAITIDSAQVVRMPAMIETPILRSDAALVARKLDDSAVAPVYATVIRETVLGGSDQAFTNVGTGSEVTMLTDTFTTVRANALVTLTLMVEHKITATDAAVIAVCVCKVDGTAQAHNLNTTITTLQGRDPRMHQWVFTLAATGSHTVLVAIRKTGAGGTVVAGITNTLMQVRIEQ